MRPTSSSIPSSRSPSVASTTSRSSRTTFPMATTNSGCQKNGLSTRSVAAWSSQRRGRWRLPPPALSPRFPILSACQARRAILTPPCFHLHFTPTGASWINLVERWFATLTEKQIRRGVHRSTRALEAAITEYIAVTNEQPRPFRWTKTADEILASVERFCRRISDSPDQTHQTRVPQKMTPGQGGAPLMKAARTASPV